MDIDCILSTAVLRRTTCVFDANCFLLLPPRCFAECLRCFVFALRLRGLWFVGDLERLLLLLVRVELDMSAPEADTDVLLTGPLSSGAATLC